MQEAWHKSKLRIYKTITTIIVNLVIYPYRDNIHYVNCKELKKTNSSKTMKTKITIAGFPQVLESLLKLFSLKGLGSLYSPC